MAQAPFTRQKIVVTTSIVPDNSSAAVGRPVF